jgi:hypothetical protein
VRPGARGRRCRCRPLRAADRAAQDSDDEYGPWDTANGLAIEPGVAAEMDDDVMVMALTAPCRELAASALPGGANEAAFARDVSKEPGTGPHVPSARALAAAGRGHWSLGGLSSLAAERGQLRRDAHTAELWGFPVAADAAATPALVAGLLMENGLDVDLAGVWVSARQQLCTVRFGSVQDRNRLTLGLLPGGGVVNPATNKYIVATPPGTSISNPMARDRHIIYIESDEFVQPGFGADLHQRVAIYNTWLLAMPEEEPTAWSRCPPGSPPGSPDTWRWSSRTWPSLRATSA